MFKWLRCRDSLDNILPPCFALFAAAAISTSAQPAHDYTQLTNAMSARSFYHEIKNFTARI